MNWAWRNRILFAATIVLIAASDASAAELKVYSTIGVQGALEMLMPDLAKSSGTVPVVTWGTAAMLVKRVEGGERPDVLILTRDGMDALAKEEKVVPGSETPFASSGIGIAVKAGVAKPDISTPEALKSTLLAAKSIAYSDPAAGGASGVYFAKLLDRMGIADAVKTKTRHPPPGGNSGKLLLTGEAELAVQQTSELVTVPGTELVGQLPAQLDLVTQFVAGVASGSARESGAKAFIASLHTATAAAAFKAKGLTPE
jgi:molybdate transport system substrate-binding protein